MRRAFYAVFLPFVRRFSGFYAVLLPFFCCLNAVLHCFVLCYVLKKDDFDRVLAGKASQHCTAVCVGHAVYVRTLSALYIHAGDC